MTTVETERLILRPAIEADRSRMVELFTDPAFTVYSDETHDLASANARFDRFVALAGAIPYAKQPVIEKASGRILGYTGVGTVVFDGVNRLEWGWRLDASARGKGYATEATAALLTVADGVADGEMLCLIDPENAPSRRVADKVGFRWWQRYVWPDGVDGPTDLLLRPIGAGGEPLLAPDLP
ncbi:MAG: GNAT family N-acetyltransferase [Actinomycetota bacterium]